MKWSSTGRRVAIATYLSSGAFVVAHTTNAFVANALYATVESQSVGVASAPSIAAIDGPQEAAETILHSGLFLLPQTVSNESAGRNGPPPVPLDAAKKATLLGTVHGREGGVMAVIEDIATKRQSLYRLGTQVPNIGALASIEKNRVLFRNGDQEEWLNLAITEHVPSGNPDQSGPHIGPQVDGPLRRVVDRREIESALADPTRLLTHAQALPNLKNGKLDGFRLVTVVPSGFFDRIGLRSNDVLQRINGVELRDPGIALNLFQQLKHERTVRVDLVRDSRPQTLTYDIR